MNAAERQKIYTLLSKFYPNARQLNDRTLLTAWGLVLAKFPYAAVKDAVLSYAAGNKFFPDLSDITAGITPVADKAPLTQSILSAVDAGAIEKTREICRRMGGPCPIIHNGDGGPCGLVLRRAVPEGCGGCGYLAANGHCEEKQRIEAEQAQCPILRRHGGEAPRAQLLESMWQRECPGCPTPCFWPKGMALEQEEGGRRK